MLDIYFFIVYNNIKKEGTPIDGRSQIRFSKKITVPQGRLFLYILRNRGKHIYKITKYVKYKYAYHNYCPEYTLSRKNFHILSHCRKNQLNVKAKQQERYQTRRNIISHRANYITVQKADNASCVSAACAINLKHSVRLTRRKRPAKSDKLILQDKTDYYS